MNPLEFPTSAPKQSSDKGTQERSILSKRRDSSARYLNNLYDTAGVPVETESRQALLQRVNNLTLEELEMLNIAITKLNTEYWRTRDPKMLDGLLMNLSTQNFKRADTKKNAKDPFQSLAESPQSYLDQLRDYPNADYSPKKATATIMEALTALYPDPKERAMRIKEIFEMYSSFKEESKKRRPDLVSAADQHQAYASNMVPKRLSERERSTIEKMIKDKISVEEVNAQGLKNRFSFTTEYVLADFIKFLERIKKS